MNIKPSHRVLINTSAQYIRTFINIVLSLYTVRVILGALGHEDYGIYNLVSGVVAMLSFITNAMITTTQRFLSYNQGKNSTDELKSIFATSQIIHIFVSLLLSILLLLLTPILFDSILDISEAKKEAAICLYYSTIGMLIISFVSAPFRALLISHENIVYVSIVDLIDVFAKFLVAIALTFIKSNKLETYGILLLCISLFNIFAFIIYSFRKYAECVFPSKKYFRICYVKELFSFAGWTIYSTGCVIGRHQGIAIILNRVLGTVTNAAYGIGFQVQSCLTNFTNAIQNAINPQLMQAEGRGERRTMLWLSTILCKTAFFVTVAIGLPTIFVMETLISWWLGDFPDYTVLFCRMTIVALIFDMTTTGLGSANQAVGNIGKYMFYVYTPKLITVLVFAYILISGYNLIWCAAAFIIFEAISAIMRIFVSRNTCSLDIKSFLHNVVYKEFLTLLTYAASLYVLTKVFVFKYAFVLIIPLGTLCYAAIFYMLGLNVNERLLIINLFKSVLRIKK